MFIVVILLGVWYEGEECCNEVKYMLSHSNIKCSTKLNMDIACSMLCYVVYKGLLLVLVVYRVVYLTDCLYFICISISLTSHISIAIPELLSQQHNNIYYTYKNNIQIY